MDDVIAESADREDPGAYCRAVEHYLCQRNQGHLVRIVGPAFDVVCGWAGRGVPLRVALRGIDRMLERQAGKGPRRRPVRVEHCEADVLDVFDEWRRATGIGLLSSVGAEDAAEESGGKSSSLPKHLDRTIGKLEALVAGVPAEAAELGQAASAAAEELGRLRQQTPHLRGEARTAALARLIAIDEGLVVVARRLLAPEATQALTEEAEHELAGFRARMPPDAYTRALAALVERMARERWNLPVVSFE